MKNQLDQMAIASLKDEEVKSLMQFEQDLNQQHQGEEVYVLVLKR